MENMSVLKISFVILSVLVSLNAGKTVPGKTDAVSHLDVAKENIADAQPAVGGPPEPTNDPPPTPPTTKHTDPTTKTTTPTPKPTDPTTKPTAPTPKPTDPTKPTEPTPTTKPPSPTPSTTPKPSPSPTTPAPTPAPSSNFHFASFMGGMVLTLGLTAIGFVSYKFYKARTDGSYHTL